MIFAYGGDLMRAKNLLLFGFYSILLCWASGISASSANQGVPGLKSGESPEIAIRRQQLGDTVLTKIESVRIRDSPSGR
jgi:hypothetical protein